MSKITKKSINSVMEIYKNNMSYVLLALTNPDDKSTLMEIPIKTRLTIDEKGMFVNRVANACFDSDGDYQPQFFEPVFLITLLQMTTSVPVFEVSIPLLDSDGNETGEKTSIVDIEKTYELCKAINLVVNVKDETYTDLVEELKSLTCKKLEFMKQLRFSQERQMLSKAREELETGVAMVSAIGQQLTTTLESAATANEITEAMKNMNYSQMVSAVMSAT